MKNCDDVIIVINDVIVVSNDVYILAVAVLMDQQLAFGRN